MGLKIYVLFLCTLFSPLISAAKTVLPDACGDDKIKFEVTTEKDQPPPAGPVAGKAQLILIQDENGRPDSFHSATVRYGIDGTWVGANHGNSYFAVTVVPGIHHLCADQEGNKRGVDMTSLTAEAGKVYYFAVQITTTGGGGGGYIAPTMGPSGLTGGGSVRPTKSTVSFSLSQLNEDQGKYRIKAWKVAVSTAK